MPRLRTRSKIIAIALLAMAAVGFTLFMEETNRKFVFDPSGHVETGSAFSVMVGDTRSSALRTLNIGQPFSLYESRLGTNCLTRRFDRQMQLDIFEDKSWRRGTVCIVSTGGVVSEVIWYYNFLAP